MIEAPNQLDAHDGWRESCEGLIRAVDPRARGRPLYRSASSSETIRAAVSGGDLGDIFTSSVNAQLISAFHETEDTTEGWCSEADVKNFKTQPRPRLEQTPDLDPHAAGATANDASADTVSEEYRVSRFTKKFTIDEIDIVNDHIEALLTIPAELGTAAARLRPNLVYSILLANAALGADSVALFHAATHGNLATTSSALAAATNWFVAASGVEAPTIEIGYLRGTGRQPVVRSYVLDQGHFGLGWDINFDIGAKALGYRGLYKATGAA